MTYLTEFNVAYKPFNAEWAVENAQLHEKIHWIEEEVSLQEDVRQWKNKELTDNEINLITQILRLFTQSDVAVGQNYCDVLIPYFKNNEIRQMYLSFANREGTHQRSYALLNDTLGLPESEWLAFLDYAEMSEKWDFMRDIQGGTDKEVMATICKMILSEGVSLFGAFIMLLNFQRFGKMSGMCTIVEWSLRDESLHVEGHVQVLNEMKNFHPREFKELEPRIIEMAKEMYYLEECFIDLAYEMGTVEGLRKEEVKEYIKYLIDRRLIQMGIKGIFKVKENPIPWLDWILNAPDHSNFFEKRVTQYSKGGVKGATDWNRMEKIYA